MPGTLENEWKNCSEYASNCSKNVNYLLLVLNSNLLRWWFNETYILSTVNSLMMYLIVFLPLPLN